MQTNKFGEIVFDQEDLFDLVMQGQDICDMPRVTVDPEVNIEQLINQISDPSSLLSWSTPADNDQSVSAFDLERQAQWHMPEEYRQLDIAAHVISLCTSQAELQRVAQELLLYQDRDLFDLLRYLKYLVDTMRANNVIWGVGRGSSVSSYVLYLMGVHRVNSMFYELDIHEFLR